ncbi:hypothetical protein PK28_11795 [Hymenobacter sp. DG25B]|uniref:MBL fold metallo-hydrolase RNA specificity domain-containing protein n=1 Tax=Hymenobacter sp. DG25B TaxID=1385664 RepID=UPI0005408E9F|nr:MBL fold metallo-hydrolase [Hymenobacter sp. DG25B]AIZ64196.1 hypothetical protein PK28_11795 [Hymenobacter sp. DG25B]
MNVSITFLGAAQTVTGSKYVLTFSHGPLQQQLMVDCGLFQGLKELRLRNWDVLPISPAQLDTVVLTHAHIDHSGYLPRLVKEGFRGRILCTEATRDLLEIMLLDSAKLQEEEAAFANAKGYSKHHPALPLYTTEDVLQVLPLVVGCPYNTPVQAINQVSVIFRDAGHILGSAMVEMLVQGEQQEKKLVFSGDLGRYDNPVMYDPTAITQADVLLVESTYGDRNNRVPDPEAELAAAVNQALGRGGVLVIAAFAVGRTQTMLYYLKRLRQQNRVPRVPVYVDSPMGIRVSGLYPRHPGQHRLGHGNIFDFDGLRFVSDVPESKSLNLLEQGAIIISASGMCTGGRIVHHLHHRLPRPQDTVLLIGFQADGTRGRRLLEGEPQIKMYGDMVPVLCHVEQLNGFSAHADRDELLRWLGNFEQAPKRTFIVHGEPLSSAALAQAVQDQLGWPAPIQPRYLETYSLFEGI